VKKGRGIANRARRSKLKTGGSEWVRSFEYKEISMTGKNRQKPEIDIKDGVVLETMRKKACPQCGTMMRWLDGDYVCVACNGAEYGPEEG
jgi:hypothetical protein